MKVKDLIKKLQALDGDTEIITPGFDESYAASEFTLKPVFIKMNVREATCHFAPHDYEEVDSGHNGYLLNGDW